MAQEVKRKTLSISKTEVNQSQHNIMKEKSYVFKQIESSITLLESPEHDLVLESLLFLSKYADLHRNNLVHIHSRGLLPKLLALLGHNICIVRVSLRLLAQLLTVEAAQVELNQEKFDGAVVKICSFYVTHKDMHVKEFSIVILATYCTMGKDHILLTQPGLIPATLKTINRPENETILLQSLFLFDKFIETEAIRTSLPQEEEFKLETFLKVMGKSEHCLLEVLSILEKLTYFNEDEIMKLMKKHSVVECIFNIIINPEKKQHLPVCLNIVSHCMNNEFTKSYFVMSMEFLKFSQWVKHCPDDALQTCANIFLELSKIDAIRQMLFDLSIEDSILSFLRSDDKKILNTTFESISFMSKHKYCCEKILTPLVVKKLLQTMRRSGDREDPENETALSTLHCLCRRDSRTVHMIRTYDGIEVLLKYMKRSAKLPEHSYVKVLEIINMFVTNNQLQTYILCQDLYEVIFEQTLNKSDEICMRSLEIMINCLNHKDFRNYFLLNNGSQVVKDRLTSTSNEQVIRLLVIFAHSALMFEDLAKDVVHSKLLLKLKKIPANIKYRNPLIQRTMNVIYDICLPVKFFERGRLELTDVIKERFYIINGLWEGVFPFLEVLQLRNMSTKCSIYVIDEYSRPSSEDEQTCLSLQLQSIQSSSLSSFPSFTSSEMKCAIKYGHLSRDPYLPGYISQVQKQLSGINNYKARIQILANFVNKALCGPEEDSSVPDKMHTFQLHIACIKEKLGTNMIPIGYLRLGFYCERALLFKALADHVYIPATLVRGTSKVYWNEVALIGEENQRSVLKMFVVDLMNNIGQLLPIGSRECNVYCNIL